MARIRVGGVKGPKDSDWKKKTYTKKGKNEKKSFNVAALP